jgi:nickel-dependent lactate racemase
MSSSASPASSAAAAAAPSVPGTLLHAEGSATAVLSDAHIAGALTRALAALGPREKVLLVPPDFTRFHSNAGVLTQAAFTHYGAENVPDIMPALGTHAPMTKRQLEVMFDGGGLIPMDRFRVHDWRHDVVKIGEVPAEMVRHASGGHMDEPWPVQLNKLVWQGGHDMVLSIGQVVPHEVMGMANHSKNLFVGVGGADAINFSHFIGACYGMERMMGRSDAPLRLLLNHAADRFLKDLPVVYALTVRGRDAASGALVTRGLFVGTGLACFERAAALSREVNFELLQEPLQRAVVYLDPHEYHSTWLGNKSIYRTRMAMADGGHLLVLAPGVKTFGEDKGIDALIRKFGYRSTPEVMQFVKDNIDLMKNLSAAAHLIHGTTEGRFRVTYCPGGLTKEEVEGVGYDFGDVHKMLERYDVAKLRDGWNVDKESGERFFYVSNPATGLWAYEGRFAGSEDGVAAGGAAAAGVAGESSPPGGGRGGEGSDAKRQKTE